LTSITDALFAYVLVGILTLVVTRRIRHAYPPDEANFLRQVYVWTLALRGALAIFLNQYAGGDVAFADAFWGDSATYDYRGHVLALYWAGEVWSDPTFTSSVSGWGFYYFVAFFYYFFGRNQLLVQLVNASLGAMTMLVIYAIARQIFDRRVARWAALCMAFFPQMIFWSSALYKDTAVMFCIALSMYFVINLGYRFSFKYVVGFTLAALALLSLRFYVFYMVAFAAMGSFLFSQRRGLLGNVLSQLVLVGVFALAFSFATSRETVERQTEFFDLRRVQVSRSDQGSLGRSTMADAGDVSTTAGAVAALPRGLLYLLFAPFPWAISGVRQLLTLPETLVWYALMPAFARGLIFTVRNRFRETLPILVFAGMLTGAYAIFQGNVGTAYRQRTQISMFFFIFMGVGLVQKREARDWPGGRSLPAGVAT
jgi:4-amino-4-deoxy-L-arabinose transferase-like glycosyltransferase